MQCSKVLHAVESLPILPTSIVFLQLQILCSVNKIDKSRCSNSCLIILDVNGLIFFSAFHEESRCLVVGLCKNYGWCDVIFALLLH